MLRALLAVILVAALGWSAYWFIGSRRLDREVEAWLEARRAEGWVAEAADVSVAGFPNRFDLTLTGLELADPDSGLAWSTPFLQLFTLSYRPDHIIAVWPNEQTVSTPFERVTIGGTDIRASLHVTDTRSLALDEATFVSEGVTFASDAGWTASLDTGRLAARRLPDSPNTYEIGFEALGLTPVGAVTRRVGSRLPESIETLKLDATVAFTAPWDRTAIEVARPQPTSIELREARATWGELDFRATGAVTVRPDGTPDGQVTVRAENWRQMLDLGVASGVVPGSLAPTVTRALELLARTSGSPETLDAVLTFRNGRMSYGLIPLGPAPRLILR